MPVGTIKMYQESRGFGFVKPDDGDADLFFHVKETDPRLVDELRAGMRVGFDVGMDRNGRACAVNIRVAP
jgi:CspA family cold shock protein